MMSKMKALIKETPVKSYHLTDVDVPIPEGDDVLIKVLKVSICGSDISLYNWCDKAKKIASLPFIPGHECVGEIVKTGPDCPAEFQVGRRVCCENHFYCGKCYQCTHNLKHICKNLNQYGHGKGTIHGGFSQYSIIPARYCYLLKTDLADDLACILEPLGVAHHAVEVVDGKGETVLVQGCGAIGLMAVAILKFIGAAKIIVVDIDESRLQRAKEMGADVLVDGGKEDLRTKVMEETNEDGVGRIIEATGANMLINKMFQLLRKGGIAVMVGTPKGDLLIENAIENLLFKSIHLKSIHGRKIFSTWEACEKMLAEKKIDLSHVITHRFPMSQFEEAFEALFSGKGCKIVVDPQS